MENVESHPRCLSNLPQDITCNIFCRLPTKSCLTCKLVCKSWYDIIVSSHFTNYRQFYGSSRSVTLRLHCNTLEKMHFVMLDLDKANINTDESGYLRVESDSVIKINFDFGVPHHNWNLANICNGLACIKNEGRWGNFYVLDLLMSKYMMIEQLQKPGHYVCGYGLGFCSENRQYKILRFLATKSYDKYSADVLTLGTDIWRSVADTPQPSLQKVAFTVGPFLNGSLHWHCCHKSIKFRGMWAFHVGKEQFSDIPTPDVFNTKESIIATVFDSCLSVCCLSDGGLLTGLHTEVWQMKEYGVEDSWVRLFVIQKQLFRSPCVPLLEMGDGQLLITCLSELGIYDLRTRKFKEVKVNGVHFHCYVSKTMVCDAYFSHGLSTVADA